MKLLPEPIFFSRVVRNQGAKRRVIHVTNVDSAPFASRVARVESPEWLQVEDVREGDSVEIAAGGNRTVLVKIMTDHAFFPKERSTDERVMIAFEDDTVLGLPVTIQEIVEDEKDFPGVFALDFGTSNSCFGHLNRFDPGEDPTQVFRAPDVSREIPSAIYFRDVSSAEDPQYVIGEDAVHDIKEYAHRTYAYFLGIKRLLGTDRRFFVMDERSGINQVNRQEYSVEQIASFIVVDLLRRAQRRVGGRIRRIAATYPTLYSRNRIEALRRVLHRAFLQMGWDLDADRVHLDLDEANAPAFNYLYSDLLEEFRATNQQTRELELLSYDFGGGTTDVSLMKIAIARDPQTLGLDIQSTLEGVSGDLHFGGDNITLEVFHLLKARLALAIAGARHVEIEEAAQGAESDDPFGGGAALSELDWGIGVSKKLDPSGGDQVDRSQDRNTGMIPADQRVEYSGSPEAYTDAAALLWEEREAVEPVLAAGKDLRAGLLEALSPEDAERILEAVERLVPTAWARYEDADPHKELAAKKIFYELWHEADSMKIRLSTEGQPQPVQGNLARLASYAGVNPVVFGRDVKLTPEQVEARLQPLIEARVKRAHTLYKQAGDGADGSLVRGARPPLKVLLAGNSSRLPLVKRLVLKVFGLEESDLLFQAKHLKSSVCQGAVRDRLLRQEFGQDGLVRLKVQDFTDRLPYAIGLYNPDLRLQGYQDGFVAIFDRGQVLDDGDVPERTLDSKGMPLIHPGLERLAVYANYRDGRGPLFLGVFDFGGKVGGGAVSSDPFQLVFRLRGDRELEVESPATGRRHSMAAVEDVLKPEDDPFSGAH